MVTPAVYQNSTEAVFTYDVFKSLNPKTVCTELRKHKSHLHIRRNQRRINKLEQERQ